MSPKQIFPPRMIPAKKHGGDRFNGKKSLLGRFLALSGLPPPPPKNMADPEPTRPALCAVSLPSDN